MTGWPSYSEKRRSKLKRRSASTRSRRLLRGRPNSTSASKPWRQRSGSLRINRSRWSYRWHRATSKSETD